MFCFPHKNINILFINRDSPRQSISERLEGYGGVSHCVRVPRDSVLQRILENVKDPRSGAGRAGCTAAPPGPGKSA